MGPELLRQAQRLAPAMSPKQVTELTTCCAWEMRPGRPSTCSTSKQPCAPTTTCRVAPQASELAVQPFRSPAHGK
jgi:hypothetical protein